MKPPNSPMSSRNSGYQFAGASATLNPGDEWFTRTAERLSLQWERFRAESEQQRIERDIIQSRGPEAWRELCTWSQATCEKLCRVLKINDLLQFKASGDFSFSLDARTPAGTNTLTVDFDTATYTINYRCRETESKFTPIVEDGQLVFTDGDHSMRAESVGRRLIDDVLGHLQ